MISPLRFRVRVLILPLFLLAALILYVVMGWSSYRQEEKDTAAREHARKESVVNSAMNGKVQPPPPLVREAMEKPEQYMTTPAPVAEAHAPVAVTVATPPESLPAATTSPIVASIPAEAGNPPALEQSARMADGFSSLRKPAIANRKSPERLRLLEEANRAGAILLQRAQQDQTATP